MLVQFVSDHYCNELGNSRKKQVGMKRFLILGFTPGNTKAVFEMVDGFLNSCSDFVSRIPFVRTADRTRVGTQMFLWIDINHPTAGRWGTRVFTMTDTLVLTSFFIMYPFHFGTYKLHSRKSAAQVGFASFPLHWQGRIFRTAGDAIFIERAVAFWKRDSSVKREIGRASCRERV